MSRWVLGVVLFVSACGGGEQEFEGASVIGETTSPLYYNADRLWTTDTISVCFKETGFLVERWWVQDIVESTFEPIANIDFTGWDICTEAGAQIAISVSNDYRPRASVGRREASLSTRARLNYFVGAPRDVTGDGVNDFETCWSGTAAGNLPYTGPTGRHWDTERRECIEAIAVHEFAHTLGIYHEQERPDTPADCTADGARSGGGTEYGYYDVTSISNYCNPAFNGDGYLSPLDVSGLVSLYGMRTDDHVWYGIGNVADYGGASINQAMFDIRAQDVGGNYLPVVGDFDGDTRDDIVWYGVSGSDHIWFGEADRTFNDAVSFRQVGNGYKPSAGDFNGDGRSDLIWHDPASGDDWIWWGRTDRVFDRSSNPDTSFSSDDVPLTGDFDGDGFGDIFMYTQSGSDRIRWGSSSRAAKSFTLTSNVSGKYTPVTGDFDADGFDDIFWYGRGSIADSIWWGRADRGFDKTSTEVSGTYDVAVADVDGNGTSDIIWSASSGTDTIWLFDPSTRGARKSTKTSAILGGAPYGGDFDGDGIGDVFWYY